jgi:hypothetical protein
MKSRGAVLIYMSNTQFIATRHLLLCLNVESLKAMQNYDPLQVAFAAETVSDESLHYLLHM